MVNPQAPPSSDSNQANGAIIAFLEQTLENGTREVARLQNKLSITYWVIVVLSVVMFILGIGLILTAGLSEIGNKNKATTTQVDGSKKVAAENKPEQDSEGAVQDNDESGNVKEKPFILGGLGLMDFILLFIINPIKRMRKIMGDISQITITINSYQTQVGLRLIECDLANKATVGASADKVREAAKDALEKIQTYYEEKPVEKNV